MKNGATRVVVLIGVGYALVGIVSAALAGQAASHRAVVAWRLTAWLTSAIAFGAHIVYEQLRLRTSPKITALHVSSAAGLGALGLAIAANVHALSGSPPRHSLLLVLSLALWPIMTALPAFLVALVSAMLVTRVWRNR